MFQPIGPEEWRDEVDSLVIEDGEPVDNILSEKQQRLLVEPLYSSWSPEVPFLAAANVGLFYALRQPPLVPDVFLSLNVQVGEDWALKQNRSYFFWEFGKAPEVVVEIVSNTVGNELGSKVQDYDRIGVHYYIVHDPLGKLAGPVLRIYERATPHYQLRTSTWLEGVGLGMTLWQGVFEGKEDTWLRWCDEDGQVIPTGAERAEQEHRRAEQEYQRAEQEHQRGEAIEQENERLKAQLRALGIEPTL